VKKLLYALLTVCILSILIIPQTIVDANAATSGTIGSCTWKLEGQKLTISGNGSMGTGVNSPWGKNITSAVIEEGVTDIASSAFYDNNLLKTVKLPSTIKKIGNSAFDRCFSLQSINLPEGLVSIGSQVFIDCDHVTEFVIPKTVTDIGVAFATDCSNLQKITVDPDNTKFKSVDGVIFSKDMTKLVCYPAGNYRTSYVVPDTVKEIGFAAFRQAFWLENVSLPNSIEKIGANAFFHTGISENKSDSDGALYIGQYLVDFKNKSLTQYTIKKGTTLIADGAFASLNKLNSLIIPDGVRYIGDSAFWGCTYLQNATIPKSVVRIEDYSFLDCKQLKNIYYRGTKSDKVFMNIEPSNKELTGATWHIESCIGKADHNWNITVIQQAKCEVAGSQVLDCKDCRDRKNEAIAPLVHSYTEPVQTKASTCTETGILTSTCTLCNGTKTSDIPLIEHSYGEWTDEILPTCTESGTQKHVCTSCGKEETRTVEALGHSFGEFVVEKEPTTEETGINASTCSNCEEKQTETIPVIEKKQTENNDATASESSGRTIWIVLALAAIIVVSSAITFIVIKKKQK